MNFLRQISFKPPPAPDAYGCVSTLEENPTSTPAAESYQESENFHFRQTSSQGPAVVIRDKLRGSPFLDDASLQPPPASPSKIKAAGSTAASNIAASTSVIFGSIASMTRKKEDPSTSKDTEPEQAQGKLMGEININWDYVAPVEKRASDEGTTDDDKLKQTQKVLEEEVCSHQKLCIQGLLLSIQAFQPPPAKEHTNAFHRQTHPHANAWLHVC